MSFYKLQLATLRAKLVGLWHEGVLQIVGPAGHEDLVGHETGDPAFEQTVVADDDVLRVDVNVVRLMDDCVVGTIKLFKL